MSCELMVARCLPRARKIAEEEAGGSPESCPTIHELGQHVGVGR